MLYIVKKTLNKIVQGGNHYLIKVKGNQSKLLKAIQATSENTQPIDSHKEEKISRGRLEIRETFLFSRQDNLAQGWESINRIVLVRRYFLSNSKEHQTDSFYITDLETNEAEHIAEGVRSHWGIENKLHYTKDVTMREDAECTKNINAAPKLALFRDFAFNILKSINKSIKYASEVFANYNIEQIIQILQRT